MTISSDAIRKAGPYVGNSIVTVFAFSFKTFSASDLAVTLLTTATGVQQLLVLNTDYTIALNGNQEVSPGGNLTTIGAISPIAATKTLTISGNVMPDTQGTDLVTPGPWVPDDVEKMADRAMIGIQQLRDRAMKFPVVDSVAPVDLPPAEARINTFLFFDAAGQPSVVSGVVSGIAVAVVNGGVPFGSGVALIMDATKLFWDNVNKRLGIGNAAPTQALDVTGSVKASVSVLTPIVDSVAGTLTLKGAGATAFTITGANAALSGTLTVSANVVLYTPAFDGTGAAFRNNALSDTSSNLALYQAAAGDTILNAGSGRTISLRIANTAIFSSTTIATDVGAAGVPVRFPNIGTTAVAANATLNAVGSNDLLRSTSSIRYKKVLRDFDLFAARALINKTRTVVFESKALADHAGEEHIGFLAEDVAAIDPRFATFDVQGRPEWVQYPTFVVPLTLMVADHERRLAALETK